MDKSFFEAFPSVTTEKWLAKIECDLKGKSLEELARYSPNTLSLNPVIGPDYEGSDDPPGKPPYTRGSKTTDNDWLVGVTASLSPDDKISNKNLLNWLMDGVEALRINLSNGKDLNVIFNEVGFPYIETHCFLGTGSFQAQEVQQLFLKSNSEVQGIKAGIYHDALNNAMAAGEIPNDLSAWTKHRESLKQKTPHFRSTIIRASYLTDCGGNGIQEIGAALAEGHEHLVSALNSGWTIDEIAATLTFELSTGIDFFQDIAKQKAFKTLWAQLIQAYKPEHSCSHYPYVHVQNTQWHYTANDQHTNLLRATTAAMSAAVAGIDLLSLHPFDLVNQPTDSARRIAKNIQLLLKEETHLNKVIDPAGGSYFLEDLVRQYQEKAWANFQQIEAEGGYLEYMAKGKLQADVTISAQAKIERLKRGDDTLIGANKYQSERDSPGSATPKPSASNPLSLIPFSAYQAIQE